MLQVVLGAGVAGVGVGVAVGVLDGVGVRDVGVGNAAAIGVGVVGVRVGQVVHRSESPLLWGKGERGKRTELSGDVEVFDHRIVG